MGGLKLNPVFSNGMVLQRDKEIKVWGSGSGGESVMVSLCGNEARADVLDGKWEVSLPPMPAAENAEIIIAAGSGRIVISDVSIGEVWIAGGQSNMELAMKFDAEAETETESDPLLRFFDVPRKSYEGQEHDEDYSEFGLWRKCGGENTRYFSAAGYYFGKKLRQALNVPVGIVGCNSGGTSASCWVTEEDLESDKDLNTYLENYRKGLEGLDLEKFRRDYIAERQKMQTPEWKEFHWKMMMCTLPDETVQEIIANSDPKGPVVGPEHRYRPVALYHLMLATIIPYTARGVIWYQGESDNNKAGMYAKLFTTLIKRWRTAWGEQLPFLFAQLAPFESWLACKGNGFPEVRHQQEIVSKTVPDAYMASIMDCGARYDIHPKRKRPVGERLSRLALNKVYGFDIPCDAPEAVSCTATAGGAEVRFINCGSGLTLRGRTLNGLQAFGENGELNGVAAEVTGDKIIVSAPEKIKEVRFAWLQYVDANLYGNDGLCAKPFKLTVTELN